MNNNVKEHRLKDYLTIKYVTRCCRFADQLEVWTDTVQGGRLSSSYRHAHGNVVSLTVECNMLYRDMSLGTYVFKASACRPPICFVLKHETMSLTYV